MAKDRLLIGIYVVAGLIAFLLLVSFVGGGFGEISKGLDPDKTLRSVECEVTIDNPVLFNVEIDNAICRVNENPGLFGRLSIAPLSFGFTDTVDVVMNLGGDITRKNNINVGEGDQEIVKLTMYDVPFGEKNILLTVYEDGNPIDQISKIVVVQ